MAERSTAAVDVAADSGDQPLAAGTQQTTADGVARSQEQETASGSTDTADEAPDDTDRTSSDAPGAPSGNGPSGPVGAADATDAADAADPETDVRAASAGTAAGSEAVVSDPAAGPEADASPDADTTPAADTDTTPDPVAEAGAAADTVRAGETHPGAADGSPGTGARTASAVTDPPARPSSHADPVPPRADSATAKITAVRKTAPAPAPSTAPEPAAVPKPAEKSGQKQTQKSAQKPAQKPSRAPELHSGFRLARRYRLEECVTRLDGFSSWRAVDEKLRRAVGVHLLPADHPRGRSVVAAARSSALLGDPRFVQILDAVEENKLIYVVQEWLPDATELTTLLASGPLEVHDAYQMVLEVTQAMKAAHRKDLAHLRLTPGAVLRTSTGQWRVRGLAINAALRGITSPAPERTDTEAIGALLYAALTQRWPYENDAHGLSGLPKGVGLIAPDQVRAGVHRGLSELAMRALVNDGATASRQSSPCTTPEELLEAIGTLPRIRPPEPAFTPPPEYRRTTYQQGVYGRPGTGGPATAPVDAPPPPLQSRTGRALKWGVSALLVVAVGLGSWQLADALLDNGTSGKPGPSQSAGSGKGAAADGKPLKIKDAREFAPSGDPIQQDEVSHAVDGKSDTAWVTPHYNGDPRFGNLPNRRDGSGIIVDLGSVQHVTGVDLSLYRSGQKVEVLAADSGASAPVTLDDFPQRLTELGTVGERLQKRVSKPVTTRYVLIHVTALPPDTVAGQYRGGISEIKILGKPSS